MNRLKIFAVFLISIALLSVRFAFSQFDYYDPYSNSNIDYFPMNPVNTSPKKSQDSNVNTNDTTQKNQQQSTTTSQPLTPAQPATVKCANKPQANPANTRSVEIRDSSGKVFYLSPPQEEVSGVKANPETSQKIFRDEAEIGLITVDNNCFPKYGYIQNAPITEHIKLVEDKVVPPDRTAAILDPMTGKVYDEKTGKLIPDARYDVAARKIYYKDTNSNFGKVFTETTGYVNIAIHLTPDVVPAPAQPITAKNCSKKTALQFNEQQPYNFCYRSDAILVKIMPNTANLKVISSDDPVNVLTITYYNNSTTIDELMKNWYRVKKKNVKNKYNISGFTYELRDADPSSPPRNGVFLINTKSNGQEFVHIQFSSRLPKEFKKLIETFRFL